MDLTQGTLKEKQERSKKMMLWFAMISMVMMFAGLISAYIVSKARPDWLKDFTIPSAFYISTAALLVSSLTFHMAFKSIQKNNRSQTSIYLILTFVLGLIFIGSQFEGFSQVIDSGYNVTGPTSNVATSLMYILVGAHIIHVFAGIIVLIVVIYNHFKQRYKQGQTLGLELGAMFWHFLDVLWVLLFLFLYFLR